MVQACQVPSPHTGSSTSDPAPVQQVTHITLLRPHTVLLLATVRGGKAVRGAFTGAMADQFRIADGKKDISAMFDCAVRSLRKGRDERTEEQIPEFRKTTDNVLIPPPASNLIQKAAKSVRRKVIKRKNFWYMYFSVF